MKLQANLKCFFHVYNNKDLKMPKFLKHLEYKLTKSKHPKQQYIINRDTHKKDYYKILVVQGNRKYIDKLWQNHTWLHYQYHYHMILSMTTPYGKRVEISNPTNV